MAKDKTQKSSYWLNPHGEEKKKRNQKPEQREEIKAAEERKKEKKDFNVNIANVGFEDRVISFNERS